MGNIEDREDLAEFFNPVDFAEPVTIGASTYNLIWTEEFVESFNVQGSVPGFIGQTSDIGSIAGNTSFTYNSKTYLVKEVENYDNGITFIKVEEQ